MADEKRYFTLVYEHTPDFMNHYPFNLEVPWGTVTGMSIGDVLHEAWVFQEALEEIRNGSSDAEQIAERALDQIDEYRLKQDWRNPNVPRRRKGGHDPIGEESA